MKKTTNTIKIGSRESPLAKIQVEEVLGYLRHAGVSLKSEPVYYATKGDKDKQTPLTENVSDDFFTDTLDEALLKGEIDLAVHSAKDLPVSLREGLSIFAITESLDETDAFVGRVKFQELPAGAKVGTSSVLRRMELKKMRPDIETVDIRGTIEERLQLVDNGVLDGIIVATVAVKRLKMDDRISDIMPWRPSPMQGALAVVGRSEDVKLKEKFFFIDVRKPYGKVVLIGAGPGDPELITLKGVRYLKKADYVFYDYLINKSLLEFAPQAKQIYVGKRKGEHSMPQSELSHLLKETAMEGNLVVRLKGGDPLLFGRGGEEIEHLRSYHIDVEVIPGVSSATAIPTQLKIPLTARDHSSSVAILSGHSKEEKRESESLISIPQVDTILFMMGLTKLNIIVRSLLAVGWKKTTPVIIISRGTCFDEKVLTGSLADIEKRLDEEPLRPPALIIAGETVGFYDKSAGPKAILYTGTNPEKYKSVGRIVHFPMIQIREAIKDERAERYIIEQLDRFDMILFTSQFAVRYFFNIVEKHSFPAEKFQEKKIIAIGAHSAAALRERNHAPDLVSLDETSEGLVKAIRKEYQVYGKKFLFPRSSLPNPYIAQMLSRYGATVKEVTVYENFKPDKRPLPTEGIDKVLFTSPSTAQNFLRDYKKIPEGWRVLSKGPLTSRFLKEAGYNSEVIISEENEG